MSVEERAALEAEIESVLLQQWDPLGAGAANATDEYRAYAHEIYNLLARGASDTQIARRLHQAESLELHHPELAERDLAVVVQALRKIERKI